MRHLAVALVVFGVGTVLACGGNEKAKDPTDEKAPDETPKWEGATNPKPDDPKPATKTSSGGTVNEAPTKRTDQYDKEGTEVALKRAARQASANCGQAKGEDGKATGPWGKITIQVQLGKNGRSKGVTVPSNFQGKPAGVCVEKSFTNLQFPPWNGADAQVDWEVELFEPGKEPKK